MSLIRSAIPPVLASLLTALLLALPAGPTLAGPAIEVTQAWARPSIPNRPGVAYLEIRNAGDTADRLVGVRAEGAGAAELHRTEEKDGMMTMAPVEAVEVPAGGTVSLASGGLHVMLFDLARPLAEGDTLHLTLEFEQAGAVAVAAPVMRGGIGMGGGGMGGTGAGGAMQHGSGHGMGGGSSGN